LAELAGGIALTLSELVTALVGWLVAKLRGHDLFDEVMREAEAETAFAALTVARRHLPASVENDRVQNGDDELAGQG
jgi:hypothetical protein